MSKDVTLVNNYYPVTYFATNSIAQLDQSPLDFWASAEQYPPEAETLTMDFGRIRPINFIDFEITSKPIDILIEYQDNTGAWQPVIYQGDIQPDVSIQYLPSLTNPWHYSEHNFELVQTQFIRLTFVRRSDPFPFIDSDLFPFSVEVRNARYMNLIAEATDFVVDAGTDILGNSFRTDMVTYPPSNTTDGDTSTYWRSQPCPSRFAVESLYYDLRNTAHTGTQLYLQQWDEGSLDGRSQTDIESYLSNGVVVDEIYIDPLTVGPTMHIYYSLDDTSDWDTKLWIPIARHYILKKGFHALPSPTFLKYLKLEFSNLNPIPYNSPEYPSFPPVTYKKFPTWVQNYFEGLSTIVPSNENFINPVDRVTINPLDLGYQRHQDLLDSGLNTRSFPEVRNRDQEIQDYLAGLNLGASSSGTIQDQTEKNIDFRSPFMYQQDLITQLDSSRALTRIAQLGETSWNAETTPVTEPPPSVQSVPDLTQAAIEKQAPMMYFPYLCRHEYQVIQSRRDSKIAYFVGIKEVGFYRRDFTAQIDEPFYIETFDDTTNFGTVNDFTQDDWRYTIVP